LDHVGTVVVEVPQLPIVALMGPPEGVLSHDVVPFTPLPRGRSNGGQMEATEINGFWMK